MTFKTTMKVFGISALALTMAVTTSTVSFAAQSKGEKGKAFRVSDVNLEEEMKLERNDINVTMVDQVSLQFPEDSMETTMISIDIAGEGSLTEDSDIIFMDKVNISDSDGDNTGMAFELSIAE